MKVSESKSINTHFTYEGQRIEKNSLGEAYKLKFIFILDCLPNWNARTLVSAALNIRTLERFDSYPVHYGLRIDQSNFGPSFSIRSRAISTSSGGTYWYHTGSIRGGRSDCRLYSVVDKVKPLGCRPRDPMPILQICYNMTYRFL
ncbi:hypothetical protein RRG08_055936 [Elysia crispata]|uniref:Uncharacterized protein n=1 Tax=Elysia crispata TaxID=231223 RepID=A0AAE1AE11_9GAST|nr:hypothetical protein RRG08_055936 [Elysia crispata]